MTDFGSRLRIIRNHCTDPEYPEKRLSQERLGELLGRELGLRGGFSGAAISDWERGKSKIHADDRSVLISLLFIFRKGGGLETIVDANELLEAGNYRALNQTEIEMVFPEKLGLVDANRQSMDDQHVTPFSFSNFFSIPGEELRTLLEKAKEGPEPAWPRRFLSLLRLFFDRWTIQHSLKAVVWIWVWLIAYALMAPSLHWPFHSHEAAISAMKLYVWGTLAIPALIGLLADPKTNAFWQQHGLATAPVTRLYTHQGAFVGFHVGYFTAFVIGLIRYFLGQPPAIWSDLIGMAFPILIGYLGARLVPYNLWKSYGRLRLTDGWIFFFFVIFGPLWRFFFLESYPYLLNPMSGVIIILLAITLLIMLMAWQYHRKRKTAIPPSSM